MKLGTAVSWSVNTKSGHVEKTGIVVGIVAGGEFIATAVDRCLKKHKGLSVRPIRGSMTENKKRMAKSYLINVNGELYWPLTVNLRKLEVPK